MTFCCINNRRLLHVQYSVNCPSCQRPSWNRIGSTFRCSNLGLLAIKIKPDVEKRSGTRVSTNTVVAAVNRLYRNLEGNDDLLLLDRLPSEIKLSLSDNVLDLLIKRDTLQDFSVI
jgi:hypothetical protein